MINLLSKSIGEQYRQDIANALSSESSRPVDDLNKGFQKARVFRKTWVKMARQLPTGSQEQIFAIRVLAGMEEQSAAKTVASSPTLASASA